MANGKKYTKLGVILEGQYGPFMVLGSTKGKEEYQYEVQVMVKNSKGEKVALAKNPLISLYDPRKRQVEEGKERKVPDNLLFEVTLVEDESAE